MDPRLGAFQTALAQAVASVIDTALAVMPAGALTPAWQGVLADYGCSPMSEHDRFHSVHERNMAKGAPVQELNACLMQLSWMSDHRMDELVAAGAATSSECDRLRELLRDIAATGAIVYEKAATQRPKSMFSHALAAAKAQRSTAYGAGGAYFLRCPACGGPRLREDNLVCAYCGNKLL